MSAEYPGALWMPAAHFRVAFRPGFSRIVIHCTDGGPDPRRTAEMFSDPTSRPASAHFVVGQSGEVVQCVALKDIAYHAHAANISTVGVEHCARTPRELSPGDRGMPPSVDQLMSSARLVAWLCRRAGLMPSRDTIVGHKEADPATTHDRCPEGSGLLLDPYVVLVKAVYSSSNVTV